MYVSVYRSIYYCLSFYKENMKSKPGCLKKSHLQFLYEEIKTLRDRENFSFYSESPLRSKKNLKCNKITNRVRKMSIRETPVWVQRRSIVGVVSSTDLLRVTPRYFSVIFTVSFPSNWRYQFSRVSSPGGVVLGVQGGCRHDREGGRGVLLCRRLDENQDQTTLHEFPSEQIKPTDMDIREKGRDFTFPKEFSVGGKTLEEMKGSVLAHTSMSESGIRGWRRELWGSPCHVLRGVRRVVVFGRDVPGPLPHEEFRVQNALDTTGLGQHRHFLMSVTKYISPTKYRKL